MLSLSHTKFKEIKPMNKATIQLIKQMRTFKLPDGSIDPDGGRSTFILLDDGSKVSQRQIVEAMIAGMRQELNQCK